ncbi:MAG TPA: ABC transporter permease [Pyrinomonadaceae bacterium]|nr:ABC transporter permease [Pyrinomonadaceae bacterium]
MKKLLSTVMWDLTLAVKYNIVAAALLVTVVYTVLFKTFSFIHVDDILIILILSDPVMLGFVFIGVLVLFEKGANTLQAVVVTPLKAWQYLWSKTISLTLIAAACSFVMAVVGHGWKFNYLYLALAVLLSSALFVMLGFIGVARVSTFNQYIIIIPLFLTPMVLPFLNFFGVTDTYWFYLIPTQASLILFRAAFKNGSTLEIAYAVVYLGVCSALAYSLARKSFEVHIIRGGD